MARLLLVAFFLMSASPPSQPPMFCHPISPTVEGPQIGDDDGLDVT